MKIRYVDIRKGRNVDLEATSKGFLEIMEGSLVRTLGAQGTQTQCEKKRLGLC
jgi:hypothetical protein